MSSLAIPASVSSALTAVNVLPHGHGHKKGVDLNSSPDSTSSTAAQVPVGAAQGLFGNAFNALQQLLGLQPPSAASLAAAPGSATAPTAATAATNANSTAASIAAAGSKINFFA
jgi:hypothetical protein